MTITLSKIKNLEGRAGAMRCLGDSLEFWSDEELKQVLNSDSNDIETWSDERLKEIVNRF